MAIVAGIETKKPRKEAARFSRADNSRNFVTKFDSKDFARRDPVKAILPLASYVLTVARLKTEKNSGPYHLRAHKEEGISSIAKYLAGTAIPGYAQEVVFIDSRDQVKDNSLTQSSITKVLKNELFRKGSLVVINAWNTESEDYSNVEVLTDITSDRKIPFINIAEIVEPEFESPQTEELSLALVQNEGLIALPRISG